MVLLKSFLVLYSSISIIYDYMIWYTLFYGWCIINGCLIILLWYNTFNLLFNNQLYNLHEYY